MKPDLLAGWNRPFLEAFPCRNGPAGGRSATWVGRSVGEGLGARISDSQRSAGSPLRISCPSRSHFGAGAPAARAWVGVLGRWAGRLPGAPPLVRRSISHAGREGISGPVLQASGGSPREKTHAEKVPGGRFMTTEAGLCHHTTGGGPDKQTTGAGNARAEAAPRPLSPKLLKDIPHFRATWVVRNNTDE